MKKRLIYAIGTTASKAIGALKSISLEDFNKETIYKSWDTDSSTLSSNLGLTADEVVSDLPEQDLVGVIQKMIEVKDLIPEQTKLYDRINEFFPLDDEVAVKNIPALEGGGSAKNPMASRLIGALNKETISTVVRNDVIDAAQSGQKEAFVVMSPCGGTSTGLSVEIINALAEEKVTVYLFLITPNYFVNVDVNSPDFYAKTPATLLRIIYDCSIQRNSITNKPLRLNPFIIESQWTQHRFAEYNPVDEDKIDDEAFVKYLSYSLYAFLKDKRSANNFFSGKNNHTALEEGDKYLNMLLVYPNNQTKTKIVKEIQKVFDDNKSLLGEDETVSKTKVEELLKGILGGRGINLSHYILTKPDFVKSKLEKWKEDKTFKSISELKEVLDLIIEIINIEQNRLAEIKPNKKNDAKAFSEQVNKKKKNGFVTFFKNLLTSLIGTNENEENEENDSKNEDKNINPELVYDLDNWCDDLLDNYKKNKETLHKESKKVNIFNDYKPEDENKILKEDDVEALKNSLFDVFDGGDLKIQNIIQELFEKQLKEETYSDFAQPYALESWRAGYQKARKKEGEVKIEGLNYHYRIIANIPPAELSYLKDEYIEKYVAEKNWKYPDKRFQYRINNDNISGNFHDWHDKMIKRLNPTGREKLDREKLEKERKEKLASIAIIGVALLENPVFSIVLGDNKKKYRLKFEKDSEIIESEKNIDLDDLVDDLINKLTKDNENSYSVIRNEPLDLDQLLLEEEEKIFKLGKDDIDEIDEVMKDVGGFLESYINNYTKSGRVCPKNLRFVEDVTYYVKGLVKKIQRNDPGLHNSFPDVPKKK